MTRRLRRPNPEAALLRLLGPGCSLAGAELSELRLGALDLTGADLTSANLQLASLAGARLGGAHLMWANLSWADLSGADLCQAKLNEVKASGVKLSRANLSGAHLAWAMIDGAELAGANLSGAHLPGVDLAWADLSGADLVGAHLSGVNLSGADLGQANLARADLSRAALAWADLSGANLCGANLCGASLPGVKLTGAKLSGANFAAATRRGWRRPRLVARYDYTDERGKLVSQVLRYQPKSFRHRCPDGRGGWRWNVHDPAALTLYRLPRVLQAVRAGQVVYVVEGEKDVEAVERAGGVATCSPGGAGEWRRDYSQRLQGARVVIVADRDWAGRRHAARVAGSLRSVAADVRMVDPAVGKDAADHLAAGRTLEEFEPTEPQLLDRVRWELKAGRGMAPAGRGGLHPGRDRRLASH